MLWMLLNCVASGQIKKFLQRFTFIRNDGKLWNGILQSQFKEICFRESRKLSGQLGRDSRETGLP